MNVCGSGSGSSGQTEKSEEEKTTKIAKRQLTHELHRWFVAGLRELKQSNNNYKDDNPCIGYCRE